MRVRVRVRVRVWVRVRAPRAEVDVGLAAHEEAQLAAAHQLEQARCGQDGVQAGEDGVALRGALVQPRHDGEAREGVACAEGDRRGRALFDELAARAVAQRRLGGQARG